MTADLPWRSGGNGGDAPKPDLVLPPRTMARWQRSRPLKRWCYVGAYGPDLMLCAGAVQVAGFPQSFWALWDRDERRLSERTLLFGTGRVRVQPEGVVVDDTVEMRLACAPVGQPVEVVSPHGASYIWTRKTPVRVTGHAGAAPVDALGLVDESAGYHGRHTAWMWSAGAAATTDGRPLLWNLVTGVHDADRASERTVWIDGQPTEPGPVRFSPGLDAVTGADQERLTFHQEATRQRRDRLGPVQSDYVQPFGTFAGTLPGGAALQPGTAFGVMERHRARW